MLRRRQRSGGLRPKGERVGEREALRQRAQRGPCFPGGRGVGRARGSPAGGGGWGHSDNGRRDRRSCLMPLGGQGWGGPAVRVSLWTVCPIPSMCLRGGRWGRKGVAGRGARGIRRPGLGQGQVQPRPPARVRGRVPRVDEVAESPRVHSFERHHSNIYTHGMWTSRETKKWVGWRTPQVLRTMSQAG